MAYGYGRQYPGYGLDPYGDDYFPSASVIITLLSASIVASVYVSSMLRSATPKLVLAGGGVTSSLSSASTSSPNKLTLDSASVQPDLVMVDGEVLPI